MAKKNKDRISFVEDGMHYMQCEICGSYVQGVSNEAESVTCSRCVLFLITSIESKDVFPQTPQDEFVKKFGKVYLDIFIVIILLSKDLLLTLRILII